MSSRTYWTSPELSDPWIHMSIPTGHGTQTLQEQERRIALALIDVVDSRGMRQNLGHS